MQQPPKVSIIIPVYNTEKYIEKCLNSLIHQTLKDIEIIIVNDGSADNSLDLVRNFANKDSRIKILNQLNQKQGAARNNGIKIATGEYIGFVDSDDWVDLDYFEKLYNTACQYNSDIALATNVRIGGGKTKKRLNIERIEFVTKLQDKIDICKQPKNPCPTNKIYRTTLLKENNILFPEHVYCEDKLFTMQAVYYANGIVTVPDINYYYFRNPNSTVNNKVIHHSKKMKKDKIAANRAVLEFLKSKIETEGADIRDKDFWAIKDEKKFLGLTLYRVKESLLTEKTLLFGLAPIKEHLNKFALIQGRYGQLIRKKACKDKLNVVFLNCASSSKWAYQSLYEEMKKSNRFNPIVLIYADKTLFKKKYSYLDYKNEIQKTVNFFRKNNVDFVLGYDIKTKKYKDLEELSPDVIFYDEPDIQPEGYKPINTSKYALNFYCSYGSAITNGSQEYDKNLFKEVFIYFVDNKYQKEFLQSKGICEKSLVFAGQLKLDEYFKPLNENRKIWKFINKKRIIIAPHFSFYKGSVLGFGTFDWNYKFFLEFAKKHPEFEFIFKPHPNLKKCIVRKGLMTKDVVENYFREWECLENAQVYDEGNYIDMFRTSDLLVTDCNSFLYEYLPTEKPVIHLISRNSVGFNEFGQRIISGYYRAENIEELEHNLCSILVNNNDFKVDTRKKILRDVFCTDNRKTATSIINFILNILVRGNVNE